MNRPLGRTCFLLTVLIAALGLGAAVLSLVPRDGLTWIDVSFVAVVVATAPSGILGLTWALLTPVLGYHRSRIACLGDLPSPVPSLAIMVPIYKEDAARVAARLVASWRSLVATEPLLAERTTFCVLSDSPEDWEATERLEFDGSARQTKLPLYYRRRPANVDAKCGKVHEFLASARGRAFDVVVGFDADSAMAGCALSRLVRILCHSSNIDVAIVQSHTFICRTRSLLSAVDGWSKSHTGLVSGIVASRFLGGGNYFGHNYAARPDALRAACARVLARPIRSSVRVLHGYIGSHDFAEGVVLSEMGYRILVDDQATSSYEETPSTLPEYVARESRWFRGSFQHLVGGWIGRGKLAQSFVLTQSVHQHLNCVLSAVGLLCLVLILLRGDAFMGPTAPSWDSSGQVLGWTFTRVPLILLGLAATMLLLPAAVSYCWNAERRSAPSGVVSQGARLLDQFPEFVFVFVYGLFVGPLVVGMVVMQAIRDLCRPPTWQAHRDAEANMLPS